MGDKSFKVTSIQGTDDDATVTIEQVAVHVEGKPVVSKHPVGRTGVPMSDFNYEGAETVFLDMKGLGSSTGESLRHAIAAFLADNKLFKHKAGENYDHDGHACFERVGDDSDE
jgi:hypothetical protein